MNTNTIRRVELSHIFRGVPRFNVEECTLWHADAEDEAADDIEWIMAQAGFPEGDLMEFAARAFFHRQNASRIREAFTIL